MSGKKNPKTVPDDKPQHAPGTERLQVILARFGIASRRGFVSLIEDGKVLVNGRPALEKGLRVDPKKDEIIVEGRHLETAVDL